MNLPNPYYQRGRQAQGGGDHAGDSGEGGLSMWFRPGKAHCMRCPWKPTGQWHKEYGSGNYGHIGECGYRPRGECETRKELPPGEPRCKTCLKKIAKDLS